MRLEDRKVPAINYICCNSLGSMSSWRGMVEWLGHSEGGLPKGRKVICSVRTPISNGFSFLILSRRNKAQLGSEIDSDKECGEVGTRIGTFNRVKAPRTSDQCGLWSKWAVLLIENPPMGKTDCQCACSVERYCSTVSFLLKMPPRQSLSAIRGLSFVSGVKYNFYYSLLFSQLKLESCAASV